jgi:hypothetical protein
MKRLGLLLSISFVFLVVLLGCSEEEVNKQEYKIPVTDFKRVHFIDEQGREVTLKKEPEYSALVNDSGVYIKINITPIPNEVHVMDEKTNEEIRVSTWKDGYPFIPYPKESGLYKMIAIWNKPNEFHVHEAIEEFEVINR